VVNSETPSSQKTVESQIVAVTVYSDTALVTRRGIVSLTGKERELVITPLPVTIKTESVRARGTGVAVRLLGVSCIRVFSSEPQEAGVALLRQQIQQRESEMSYLQAQLDGLTLQSRFLEGLREKTEEPFAQSLSRKNLSPSETLDFLNFLGSQYSEYAIASGECKTQKQELAKQLQALHQQLDNIQTPHPTESFNFVVGIESLGTGEFELEVSYVVSRASWKPLYDLRVNSISNTLSLGYLAEVTQNTGEDWLGVALTLSTAKPGLGTLPPKLAPWYIDTPEPPVYRSMRRSLAVNQLSASVPGVDDEVIDESIEAENAVTEVAREGSVVTFKLNGDGNIPSDGAPHKTTIFNDDFPCRFDYVAMPRLVSFAYLQANVKNPVTGVTLLPGNGSIFRDNMFVATTHLENVAPGQEFKLNLGIDEGLKIERELVERQVDKKLIGSDKKITYAYRIIITNLQNQVANLKLSEQLPVSRNEQIKVRLGRSNPQIQIGEMGSLEWLLALQPEGRQEIYYQFIIEHPAQLTVNGLDI
jgi:uncharacterized protein (TIGR02231 family)